jgi:hypothetical protein
VGGRGRGFRLGELRVEGRGIGLCRVWLDRSKLCEAGSVSWGDVGGELGIGCVVSDCYSELSWFTWWNCKREVKLTCSL